MKTTKSQDRTESLKSLGQAGATKYNYDTPSPEILETFPNNFPGRPYIISIEFPEYTSLCPVTGQPDFATIIVEYIPDELCVESKSFKLYMGSYRNHQSFMETITNNILDHFVESLSPLWMRVKGIFSPRGGTGLHVFAEHYKKDSAEYEQVRDVVKEWKSEANRHGA
ncbi:preQ(1) synthase [Maridesulfovibrio hydrothermalis]|uniref:NADPH-dependent 7-cyano-7-deazaguanine reductase n=1 Tax=Maridesulfovibrio hydrothermalis AM13 = DSM 14728 TaxID=1121451 RepID=L0RB75_9BACT|nr:preQ(1) synthase [Maridesulfovibrio hydrothermalis]CCO23467.1 NADPH-dependent 7-cyano-7-deazaguanine reductase [Maridesulfovibrio hydrothermalis AM13 = DSM 14728]